MNVKEHFCLTDHELYMLLSLTEHQRRDVLSDVLYPLGYNAALVFLLVYGALHDLGPVLLAGMVGVLVTTIQGIQGRLRYRNAYQTLAQKIITKVEAGAPSAEPPSPRM